MTQLLVQPAVAETLGGYRRGLTGQFALWAITAALLCLGCEQRKNPAPLMVYAAVSLQDVLQEVAREFLSEYPSEEVIFSFAGSNQLARQLISAPKADLFISANPRWFERVQSAGAIAPGSKRVLLENELVLVGNNRDTHQNQAAVGPIEEILPGLEFSRLVLGDPEAVPAGEYAKQYLQTATDPSGRSLWSLVEQRVLPMPDVRSALRQVERGKDLVGIVYRTDAMTSNSVSVLATAPPAQTSAVRYICGLIERGDGTHRARRLLKFLQSERAHRIFRKHGFLIPQTARTRGDAHETLTPKDGTAQ